MIRRTDVITLHKVYQICKNCNKNWSKKTMRSKWNKNNKIQNYFFRCLTIWNTKLKKKSFIFYFNSRNTLGFEPNPNMNQSTISIILKWKFVLKDCKN
jgi:hypothetical protein